MLPMILMILGTALTALGIIGLIGLSIQPFFKAVRVVFFHSTDDLKYDSAQGRITLEREYKVLRRAFTFFLIAGLACLGTGRWLKDAPRGKDSLQSEFIEGAAAGNDAVDTPQGKEDYAVGNPADTGGNRYSCIISISGKTIRVNGQEIGGTEELEEYLKPLDRGNKIFLKDDFAVSPVFHKAEELLDAYGMNYETESGE